MPGVCPPASVILSLSCQPSNRRADTAVNGARNDAGRQPKRRPELAYTVEHGADQRGGESTCGQATEHASHPPSETTAKRAEKREFTGVLQHAHEARVAEQRGTLAGRSVQQPCHDLGAKRAEGRAAKHAAYDPEHARLKWYARQCACQ
jgi:hypothetical protein